MRSSRRRLIAVVLATPMLLILVALAYQLGMEVLEEQPRDFWAAFAWAAETITTTGYGHDSHWTTPGMIVFVTVMQFLGVGLTFLVFSLVVVPFFVERFEGRLPRKVPRKRDYVLVYRFGPAVSSLLDELDRAKIPSVVLEEDEPTARRLLDRGREVFYARLDDEDPDRELFARARAIVANGTDQQNGAFILAARQQGFEGEVVALAEQPLHRKPMMLAGATSVYTPLHILAAAMASLASERVSPRVMGIARLGGKLRTAELRIGRGSELAGRTLADSGIRAKTGATIIGQWIGGEFIPHPPPHAKLVAGAILVAVGSEGAIEALGKLATPLQRSGPFVICGWGEVGSKIAQLLTDAGEPVVIVDQRERPGVDVVGDVLDQPVLEKSGVRQARAVIFTLADDATTLFAASVVRDFDPDVPIVASVRRTENVERIHRAGADFALSLGQVAGGMLAQKMLGEEWLSLEARVKLVTVKAATLAGHSPTTARVGENTGCSIVAVERLGEIMVDFPREFRIRPDDVVHIAGPESGIDRYFESYPEAKL